MPKVSTLLDVDYAVLADLVDGVGDHVADLVVGRGDGRHAGDLLLARDLGGLLADVLHYRVHGVLDAAPQAERVGPGRHVLEARAHDLLGEQGGGGGAVAGNVVGRGRDLAERSWAPWLRKTSSTSISRAIVTPSLVMVGAPNFLSRTT